VSKVDHESPGEIKMIGFAQGERKKFYEKCRKLGKNEVRFGRPIGHGSDGGCDCW